MKKFSLIACVAVVLALVGSSVADTSYTNAFGQVVTINSAGIATVAVPTTAAAATATYGAYLSQSVTNGQDVAIVPDTVNILTSYGGKNLTTNTITVATFASTAVGKVIWVFNAAASTNLLAIAQTGNYDGPAIELSAGQGAFLYVAGTTSVLGK